MYRRIKMAWKKNVIKTELRSYPPYIIMGVPKSGKTSLFRDLILHNYQTEEAGLLLSLGDEEGYLALDRLQVEAIKEWNMYEDSDTGERGFIQVVDDLIENREKYKIQAIALDTWDKLADLATKEVFELHRKAKGSYPKSLNEALGGYGAGGKKVAELMMEQVSRLRGAGYAIFVIAHTKKKDKTDPATGETYEQITNDLMSTFYNPIANIAQMIVNIIIERDIKDGKQVGINRMMYFRDNGYIDAGGRFNGLPDKLELSAENFMSAFKIGVKNSSLNGELSDKEIEKKSAQEVKELEAKAKASKEKESKEKQADNESQKKKEILSLFQSKATSLSAEQLSLVKEINAKYEIKDYKNVESIPMEALEEILIAIR